MVAASKERPGGNDSLANDANGLVGWRRRGAMSCYMIFREDLQITYFAATPKRSPRTPTRSRERQRLSSATTK
jgi:hypothetical protein